MKLFKLLNAVCCSLLGLVVTGILLKDGHGKHLFALPNEGGQALEQGPESLLNLENAVLGATQNSS